MNAAEIVIGKMQRDSSFEMRQLFAERIGKPRKTAHLHSHRQILPFDKASRDVIFVRPSVDDLGYNLPDSWWGVPRVGAIVLSVIPEQFHKLSEVGLPCKDALNRAVEVIAVRRDLKPLLGQALLKSRQEFNRRFLRALADLEVRHKLGYRHRARQISTDRQIRASRLCERDGFSFVHTSRFHRTPNTWGAIHT